MTVLAFFEHKKHYTYHNDSYTIEELKRSPYTPGVSIVAPAYNEEKTVITNVNSLLNLDYPDFEVVIVNDGSKDKTLELLIENFDLVKVPYAYV
ncbi:MAG: glycosyltransferase, partial [Bacteroidales bacterium]|nr:glycosyltransferase [Bacteroidales bacterium]